MRTYTAQQVEAFEQHHGKDMVLIFTVGEDEYAFRRLSELDVDLALSDKEAGKVSFHEDAAIRCVLTADAPRAGMSGGDAKLSKEDLAELVKERERLALEWKHAAMMRDAIGQALAMQCGYHWTIKQRALGAGAHQLTMELSPEYQEVVGDAEPVELTARSWADREYNEFRTLNTTGAEGEAERYAYNKLITSPNKTDVARTHPWLVIAIGKYLHTLGVTKAVRLKKSRSGQALAPGASTSTEGAAISP